MPPGAQSRDAALIHALADASRRLTRTRIEDFLVTRGFYSLSSLRGDPTYSGLGKRELLDAAFEEREHWELINALADEGAFSDATIAELRRVGFLEEASTNEGEFRPNDLEEPSHRLKPGRARPSPQRSAPRPPRQIPPQAWWKSLTQALKVTLVIAIIGALGVIAAAVIQYLAAVDAVRISIHATQTAEAAVGSTPTSIPSPSPPPSEEPPEPTLAPTSLPQALILSPRMSAVVSQQQTIEGSVSSIPSGVRIFLCVRASGPGGRIYPQDEIRSSGRWDMSVVFQTSLAAYEIFVVATSSEDPARTMADQHFRVAGMAELPPGAFIISPVVNVTRD